MVSFSDKALPGLERAFFAASVDGDVKAMEKPKELRLAWTSSEGISVIKTYSFFPDTYEIGLEIKVRNLGPAPVKGDLRLSLRSVQDSAASRYVFSGPAALINGELEEIKAKEIAKNGSYSGTIGWVAHEDQ
jgi:YidC/Oxa1 family membrane protein insertase